MPGTIVESAAPPEVSVTAAAPDFEPVTVIVEAALVKFSMRISDPSAAVSLSRSLAGGLAKTAVTPLAAPLMASASGVRSLVLSRVAFTVVPFKASEMGPVVEKAPIVALLVAVALMPSELAFRLMAAAISLADAPAGHVIGEVEPSGLVKTSAVAASMPLLPAAAVALAAAASPSSDPATPFNDTALRPSEVTRASAKAGMFRVWPEFAPIWNGWSWNEPSSKFTPLKAVLLLTRLISSISSCASRFIVERSVSE